VSPGLTWLELKSGAQRECALLAALVDGRNDVFVPAVTGQINLVLGNHSKRAELELGPPKRPVTGDDFLAGESHVGD